MVEEIRKGWPLFSWRTACLVCALLVLFMSRPQPSFQEKKLSTAANSPQKAVTLSFITSSVEHKTAHDKSLNQLKKSPEPLLRKQQKAADTQHNQKALSPQQQTAPEPQKIAPNEELTNTENQPVMLASPDNHKNNGVHVDPIITEPVFANTPTPPSYPKLARKRGQEGIVLLEVWLDEWGKQLKLAILESSGAKLLDQAAVAAVSNWQFEPHTVNGVGTTSRVHIPVEFALR